MRPRKTADREPECQRAIDAAGGPTVIAIALGIASVRPAGWLRIPAEYVPRLELLTGIPGRELRPDMYVPLNPVSPEQIRPRAVRGSDRRDRSSPQTTTPPAALTTGGGIGD